MTGQLDYSIKVESIRSGFDPGDSHCWVHPKMGAIPGEQPTVIMTMSTLFLKGSDIFGPVYEMRTTDLGKTWKGPIEHASTLGRRRVHDSRLLPEWDPGKATRVLWTQPPEVGICDFVPSYHQTSGKLLGTGQTVYYVGERIPRIRPREVVYAAYDPRTMSWTPWDVLDFPDREKFYNVGAGCAQRVDLSDGDILLPVSFSPGGKPPYTTTVLRCAFDGKNLQFIENGSEHTIEQGRGLYEASLVRYGGQYYLTMRNDEEGYVAVGDGLNFDKPQVWRWDDGQKLPTYNTQQHWVVHSEGLFLVYTRRAEDNDHVFRHRAPLFIAEVDPEGPRVIRETERVLIPERGARLGNFDVVHVTEGETWVSTAEWMQPEGCEQYGSDNSIFVARIIWDRPNRLNAGG